MVFQEPRLLPWRTVEQNVRLAAPQATDAALDTLFATLGLAAHRDHYPGELSLGLARRVALARAFAVEPDLLLLDEPFVSLDDALAARLRDELAELVNRRPVTTLLVTHNVDEAIGLADRLFLLSPVPRASWPMCRSRGRAPRALRRSLPPCARRSRSGSTGSLFKFTRCHAKAPRMRPAGLGPGMTRHQGVVLMNPAWKVRLPQ